MSIYCCHKCLKQECSCDIDHYNNKHVYFDDKLRSLRIQTEVQIQEERVEYVVRLFKGEWKGRDERDKYLYGIKDGIYKFGPCLDKYRHRAICRKDEFIKCANRLGIEYTETIKKLSVWEKIVKWLKYGDKEYQGTDVNTRSDPNWMRVKQSILEGMKK